MQKTDKLGNPMIVAAAASKATEVIPFVLKSFFILGLGSFIYYKFTNRFTEIKENRTYPASNISETQAKSRADAIYGAVGIFSNNFSIISDQISGLNYNAFVRVYNAFGKKDINIFNSDLTLIEFLQEKCSEYELKQLSFLLNGAFF